MLNVLTFGQNNNPSTSYEGQIVLWAVGKGNVLCTGYPCHAGTSQMEEQAWRRNDAGLESLYKQSR